MKRATRLQGQTMANHKSYTEQVSQSEEESGEEEKENVKRFKARQTKKSNSKNKKNMCHSNETSSESNVTATDGNESSDDDNQSVLATHTHSVATAQGVTSNKEKLLNNYDIDVNADNDRAGSSVIQQHSNELDSLEMKNYRRGGKIVDTVQNGNKSAICSESEDELVSDANNHKSADSNKHTENPLMGEDKDSLAGSDHVTISREQQQNSELDPLEMENDRPVCQIVDTCQNGNVSGNCSESEDELVPGVNSLKSLSRSKNKDKKLISNDDANINRESDHSGCGNEEIHETSDNDSDCAFVSEEKQPLEREQTHVKDTKFTLKLVPLENLMAPAFSNEPSNNRQQTHLKDTKGLVPLIDLKATATSNKPTDNQPRYRIDSSSSSDSSISAENVKKSKKMKKKTGAKLNLISSDDEDSNFSSVDPFERLKQGRKTKLRSIVEPPKIKKVAVRLTKLPRNMEKLLYKHKLSEIRDHHQNVIVSRQKSHRHKKRSVSESKQNGIECNDHSDASSIQSDKSARPAFDELKQDDEKCVNALKRLADSDDNSGSDNSKTTKNPIKSKQPTADDSSDSDAPLKRKTRAQNRPQQKSPQGPKQPLRTSKRKRIIRIIPNISDDDSSSNEMRKKTQPRSSAGGESDSSASDSLEKPSTSKDDNESDSDYEAEEKAVRRKKTGSESDEDFQPSKKRRVIRSHAAKKNKTDDDDDDDDDEDYDGDSKRKKRRRKRIRKNSDSSDDNDDDDDKDTSKKGRKNIRRVIGASELEEETKRAAKEEQQRKKRIEERQKMYNQMYDSKLEEVTEMDKLVLDFDEETKEELISVDKKLVKKLKPHQAQGVKFMWDACFESIKEIKEGHGGGCILAHCMGLGKTLQVVTLVHTLLSYSEETNVEKVLIICPVSTVLNWVNEFRIWLRHCKHNRDIDIYEISKYKQNTERAFQINEWHKDGGVLIMGYDMFRNLSTETGRIRKKQRDIFQAGLVDPGADLVVCDEGHLLKNSKTSLSKAVNRIRTLRRIVLTGTPLQNNLNEYYCMVQFVKPNLLGKYNEYLNRFVNPITNGQYTDSTPYDIQMMKRRSHILHKLLDGCVQRKDYSVLSPFLPPKQEYVLYIRLTKLQVDLYKFYMANKPCQFENGKTRTSVLFADFQNLQRVWTHPLVLRYNSDRYDVNATKKRMMASDEEDEVGSLKDFIADSDHSTSNSSSSSSSDDDSSVQSVHSDEPKKHKKKEVPVRRTRANAKDFSDAEPSVEPIKADNPTEWWMPMCPQEELNNIEYSGKLMLLFSILTECEAIGDKLLVFSQSLFSLDVIEHFLALVDANTQNPNPDAKLGGFTGSWAPGLDYFRLDGSTNIETRNIHTNHFNSESNLRARLFLISTRAGGLGINLVAANRVIIFDASWNPSHDIQSIFRVYRFGQKKPCYIYRFIALGTMEEKIYERQVTKLAISKRVIDEHQIDRHYKENDLNELYNIENIDPEEERQPPMLPKDRLFADQLQKYADRIYKYHEHDSLLENKAEETLSNEEIQAAWKEFEEEKNRPTIQPTFIYPQQPRAPGSGPVTSNTIFGFRSDILLQLLNIKARRAYPGTTNVSTIVPILLKHLYESMQNGDQTFYHELCAIHSEMAAPAPAQIIYGGNINPAASIMPSYSGRGRPTLTAQQNAQAVLQQQHLIQQTQNRLMNLNNGTAQLPPSNQIIEID